MKKKIIYTATFTIILLLSFVGCSNDSELPIEPTTTDQPSSLEKKVKITNYTYTELPKGVTGEGEIKLVGKRWIIKNYGLVDQFLSSDPLINGTMTYYLNSSLDAVTGEGPCHGKWTLVPTGDVSGGVWEGTYQGYRFKSNVPGEWTLRLKAIGRGKGGIIDRIETVSNATLTVYTDGVTVLPTYWKGEGKGYYISHCKF